MILSIQDVVKSYGNYQAVNHVSFDVPKGSVFGLLGPNGAGKTSLIRMITTITGPDSGAIYLEGEKLNDRSPEKIGYMPEERGLYKKMKVGEHLMYLAQLKGLSRSDAQTRIKQWFVKFEMESWWNKKVEDLSKGMSQKLQFVTTVLHNPKLIILDEPFSGLDPVNSNLIKDEIFNLAKNGATIIFSTHRMEQVEEICDHIALVNKGKKILDGTVKQVKQDFKENLFSIGADDISSLNGSVPFEVVGTKKHSHIVRIKEGSKSNDVLQYLLNQNVAIHSFNEILPSLNDIFIKLVEGTPTARQFQQL